MLRCQKRDRNDTFGLRLRKWMVGCERHLLLDSSFHAFSARTDMGRFFRLIGDFIPNAIGAAPIL